MQGRENEGKNGRKGVMAKEGRKGKVKRRKVKENGRNVWKERTSEMKEVEKKDE